MKPHSEAMDIATIEHAPRSGKARTRLDRFLIVSGVVFFAAALVGGLVLHARQGEILFFKQAIARIANCL